MANTDKEHNSTVRVLLVDQDHEQSYVTGMLLVAMGYQVQVCNSGSDCINVTETFSPHVILLDIDMPAVDGFQVCGHIRKQMWGKQVRIIALTGRSDNQIGKFTPAGGFDGHLNKLAGYQDLSDRIAEYLRNNCAAGYLPNNTGK
ncbi:response regulator [Dyadobacter sp. CY323]|uniref:response regulator n=1 Tax=Dyadobacter sp. CY323 TaxID=2907302 RepID=UPI001F3C8017|nr:response regulator [Dyadobacter sp. CY323]MCE6989819.1 response regulator [Dyadobacter sp. CY323]